MLSNHPMNLAWKKSSLYFKVNQLIMFFRPNLLDMLCQTGFVPVKNIIRIINFLFMYNKQEQTSRNALNHQIYFRVT